MIELREYKENEIKIIEEILLEEKIEDREFDGILYVALEDGKITGVSKVVEKDNKRILSYLIIKDIYRGSNLGDSLLRAILSKVYKIGVEHIHYRSDNSYLSKKGFKSSKNGELVLNIEDFFANGCRSCGELNVL